jgi:hypothetical protein
MRHQTDNVPALICDAGNVTTTAIGVDVEVAGNNAPLGFKLIEGLLVGDVTTFTVLERDHNLLTHFELRCPRRGRTFNSQFLIAANEMQVIVSHECARQQVGFAQHLKTVANAEDWHSAFRSINKRRHDWSESRNCTTPQVVAIGETTGEHDRINAMEIGISVPECYRLATSDPHRSSCIAIVE